MDDVPVSRPGQARAPQFQRPSRIRGAAGTGKTDVGLHRATYLARSQADAHVLLTTYVRRLPEVLGNLLGRMAPEVASRVEFGGVHQFARRVLDERGIDVTVNAKAADQAFADAWREASAPLPAIEANARYWKEELDHVIKGRALTSFDEYAKCPRTGRRRLTLGPTPLRMGIAHSQSELSTTWPVLVIDQSGEPYVRDVTAINASQTLPVPRVEGLITLIEVLIDRVDELLDPLFELLLADARSRAVPESNVTGG